MNRRRQRAAFRIRAAAQEELARQAVRPRPADRGLAAVARLDSDARDRGADDCGRAGAARHPQGQRPDRRDLPGNRNLPHERDITQATLTFATMCAVAADQPGVRLTRSERCHVEKFVMWPLTGDTKAVAVRPRITDLERARAEHMIEQAREPKVKTQVEGGFSRGVRVWFAPAEEQPAA